MKEDSFHLGVKALIFNAEDKLLLLRAKSYWDLPGGRIHKNETIEGALRREVYEETGLQNILLVRPFVMVLSDVRVNTPSGDVGLIYSTHICQLQGSEPICLSQEHQSFAWFDSQEAASLLKAPSELTSKLASLFSAKNNKESSCH